MNSQETITAGRTQVHQPHFSLARIMSPFEVDVETQPLDERPLWLLAGHWVLCGDLGETTFAAMANAFERDFRSRLSTHTSPLGGAYGLLTHQVGCHQHRFLLPLWDARVHLCLEGIVEEGYGYMLGRNGQEESLLLSAAIPPKAFEMLLKLGRVQPLVSIAALAAEMPIVVATTCRPDSVPSMLEDVAVEYVSVSVVPALAVIDLAKTTGR